MDRVYFNQTDSRWKDIMYSSTGNSSQTIGNSGCGPTAGAMVVSSLTDQIVYPNQMAEFYVKNGYRTANNGTSWAAFPATAEKYGLSFKQTANVNEAIECLKDGGMVIASVVGSPTALFSTNGHLIVISEVRGNDFVILDPYLYNGKYNINGRDQKATVVGNEVYVSIANTNAEVRQYFCYYPKEGIKQKYVNVNTTLNVRSGPGTNYPVVGSLSNNTKVTVYEEKDGFSRIDTNKWVSSQYLSDYIYEKDINVVMTVTAKSGLNVRNEPSATSQIVIAYPYGTRVTIYEKRNNWARGIRGWMSLDYLQ